MTRLMTRRSRMPNRRAYMPRRALSRGFRTMTMWWCQTLRMKTTMASCSCRIDCGSRCLCVRLSLSLSLPLSPSLFLSLSEWVDAPAFAFVRLCVEVPVVAVFKHGRACGCAAYKGRPHTRDRIRAGRCHVARYLNGACTSSLDRPVLHVMRQLLLSQTYACVQGRQNLTARRQQPASAAQQAPTRIPSPGRALSRPLPE